MAISMGGGGKRRVMAEINITPFTDVCLVLLIIFMVSASFLGKPVGKDVKLPKATHKSTSDLPAQDVTITMVKDGTLYLDNNPVTFTDLYSNLKSIEKTDKSRKITIKADQGMLYDQVVKVMDAVRESGLSDMSLAVEQSGNPPPPPPRDTQGSNA